MPFLSAVMAQERFREGRLTTGYIAEEFPDGFTGVSARRRRRCTASGGARLLLGLSRSTRAASAPRRPRPRRAVLIGDHRWDFAVRADGIEYWLDRARRQEAARRDRLEARHDARQRAASMAQLHHVRIDRVTGGFRLRWRGADLMARVLLPRVADLMPLMPVKVPPDLQQVPALPDARPDRPHRRRRGRYRRGRPAPRHRRGHEDGERPQGREAAPG